MLKKNIEILTPIFNALNPSTEVTIQLIKVYNKFSNEIARIPASTKYHHNEIGGYLRHLIEMFAYAKTLYRSYAADLDITLIDFDMHDVAVLILVHDLSKLLMYIQVDGQDKWEYNPKYKRNFTLDTLTYWMLAHLSIKLTIEQFVALMNIAGGWSEICKVNPRLEPNALGTFMHLCDMYSSQMLGKYKEE